MSVETTLFNWKLKNIPNDNIYNNNNKNNEC